LDIFQIVHTFKNQMELGGNVETMNSALLGRQNIVEKSVESEDPDTHAKNKTTSKVVDGRVGGVLNQAAPKQELAPVPGAAKGKDGNWYVERGGRFFRVDAK
jgi:hypothetical protein